MNASSMMKNIASIFCSPWNRFFPSTLVRSNRTSPLPLSNCRMILAVTIGPIPSDMILPNCAPRTMDKNSRLSLVLALAPKTGMSPSVK